MTDINKLKVWAEALAIRAGSAGPDISADVLGLIEEVEKLRADTSSMRGSLNANSKCMKKLIKDGTRAAKERDRLRAENEALRGALKPFAEFERVRSAMGGNAPREGILYGVHSNTGSAELHVEHMQAAQSALEGATQ
ncbi:hypothetical protein ACP0IR_26210 [Pseudomonas aeruginosa]